ncbi:MAG: SusC/RagA family TonB-linked outer membrane protein, partial [Bacteroidales bacterium]|nr:SusC/RagA family TonB-linked outer membrane protein [Bacteroidales bacterium]
MALAIFLLPVRGWSQVESVQGSVTDASNGEPIPGAFVIVRGTDNGASTDQNGHYVLSLKGDNNTVLVFSCIGYKEQTVSIGKRNVVDVSLSPDSEYLNEVVVIGYGTLDKKELTSAVAHVSSKEFLATSGSDPTMMIQGKVAGVSIENTAAADPNNQASIQIRGISSRTAGLGPLIVIDGIAGGNLTNVNPNDIESIDILKDGAASAIYGTRGSNGVVLINTKKGSRDGSFHTTYDMVAAANVMVNDLQMLSADEFREKKVATGMAEDLGGNDDWLKAVSRVGLSHQHTVTLSGGNMDNNFRVSADYRKATGIDKRSEREEYGARASFNHNSKNGLFTFVLNMAPRLVKSKSADWHVFHYAIEANPTTPIYNPEDPSKYFDFTGQRADKNPMEIINTELNDHEYKLLDMDATVRMNILPGLTSQLTYSDQYIGGVGGYFIPSTNNKTHRSEASRSYDQTEKHAIEWVNNFQKSFGSHNLKAMAGYSWQTLMYSGFSASNKDFANDGMTYDSIGQGEWGLEDGHDGTSSYRSDSKLIAFFGRVNYDYQGKYLFTASLRYEGSSKFGTNHKWGYFPAVSAGWRISQEEFMKGCSGWLNDLKLRADFGVTGNQDFDSYMSLSTMTGYGQYYYQGNWLTVWGPSKNVNPDLRWEKGINWNVGLDFALLNNRISGSVNYFNRTQKDLLGYYNVSIPPYLFSSTFANVGTMKNSGIEFELQSTIVDTKDLSYSISLVGSTMDNRFVS